MTAWLIEIMAAFTIAFLIALFVVPTALASMIGAQWYCAGGSLVLVAITFALFLRATWLNSQRKS